MPQAPGTKFAIFNFLAFIAFNKLGNTIPDTLHYFARTVRLEPFPLVYIVTSRLTKKLAFIRAIENLCSANDNDKNMDGKPYQY